MLKEEYFECGYHELLVDHQELNEEEKFFQVLTEMASLNIQQIQNPETRAGSFAQEMSTLYHRDVIIIKEANFKTNSVALVYWKEWNKFSFITFKKTKVKYVIENHNFDINLTEIVIEKFNQLLESNEC